MQISVPRAITFCSGREGSAWGALQGSGASPRTAPGQLQGPGATPEHLRDGSRALRQLQEQLQSDSGAPPGWLRDPGAAQGRLRGISAFLGHTLGAPRAITGHLSAAQASSPAPSRPRSGRAAPESRPMAGGAGPGRSGAGSGGAAAMSAVGRPRRGEPGGSCGDPVGPGAAEWGPGTGLEARDPPGTARPGASRW